MVITGMADTGAITAGGENIMSGVVIAGSRMAIPDITFVTTSAVVIMTIAVTITNENASFALAFCFIACGV